MKAEFDKENYLIVTRQPLAGSTFINLIKVLIENRFRVNWKFIPRALYVFLMTIFTTPLRIQERKKFDKKIEKIKIKQPIFIIGHWRSGTTFLNYLMSQDKKLAYSSTMETLDPSIFLAYENLLKSIVTKSLPNKRPMDNLEMKAMLPYEEEYAIANLSPYSFYHAWYFPKKIDYYFKRYVLFEDVDKEVIEEWEKTYTYFLQKISYKHDGKQIMLKSLVNTGKIKYLLAAFPDAKFIHLYRNPYEVYMSTWKLYNSILPIFSFQDIDKGDLDKSIINIYKQLYSKFLEQKHLIPKQNLIELKFEDFIKEPMKTVEIIYSKLDIPGFKNAKPAFEKYVKKHENYKKNHHKFDEEIKDKVSKEWDFAFKEFGYKK